MTETALITDLNLVASQLASLRQLGLCVAIDDFGTGYTSVAHLRAMRIDEIKIDASFVARLDDDAHSALVEMIQQLSRHLALSTVAEGVETSPQLALLRQLGCEAVQGHLMARPMPPGDLPGWVTARRRGGTVVWDPPVPAR